MMAQEKLKRYCASYAKYPGDHFSEVIEAYDAADAISIARLKETSGDNFYVILKDLTCAPIDSPDDQKTETCFCGRKDIVAQVGLDNLCAQHHIIYLHDTMAFHRIRKDYK